MLMDFLIRSFGFPIRVKYRNVCWTAERILKKNLSTFQQSQFGQRCCPFFNLVNGVDRISEDKISAAVLRKFVNAVYDIMRDVKIPRCCRGFLLWMFRILVEYKFYHQMIHTWFIISFRTYDLVFRKVAKNLSCSRWWKSCDVSCNSIWYWSILSQML